MADEYALRESAGFSMTCGEHGGDAWTRVSVAATECPRIPAEFLEEERSQLGPVWFEQEYLCSFVDNGMAIFGRDGGGLWIREPLT